MSISIANAALHTIKVGIASVIDADIARNTAQAAIANDGADRNSASVATAVSKIIVAGQKLRTIMPAFATLEEIVKTKHALVCQVAATKHKAANYPNGKPTPFLADYDIVPAQLIFGRFISDLKILNILGKNQGPNGSALDLIASMALVGGATKAWAPLQATFTNFLRLVGTDDKTAGFGSCDFSALASFDIPALFRVDLSNVSNNDNRRGDGGVADVLELCASADQKTFLTPQQEPLRKELETLEYNHGVAKTRFRKEYDANTAAINSPENSIKIAAQRAIYYSRSLMIATELQLVDYHFRVGRYLEAAKYAAAAEENIAHIQPIKPSADMSTAPEARLSEDHFALIGNLRHATTLAKIAVYHTFHTEFYVYASSSVTKALSRVQAAINAPPSKAAAAAAAKANQRDSGPERFARAMHAYEREYEASPNNQIIKLGAPFPFYGLPDVEVDAAHQGHNRGGTEPIQMSSLQFEGHLLLEDFNMQTAFNPFCAPLFNIPDYTLLAIASFYLPIYEVAITSKRRLLVGASSFNNKIIVSERRKLFRQAVEVLQLLRVEELTSAQYDQVKTLMFGEYSTEGQRIAKEKTLAAAISDAAQTGSDATVDPNAIVATYTDNTPVLCEIAKTASVLAISCLTRDELKSSFLALPEIQSLLSIEAEAVDDLNEKLNSPPVTNPATGKVISTSAKSIVKGCYDTFYSDAMVGLTATARSILGEFFPTHPLLADLVPHCIQDIRESIIGRLLQPYASISIAKMAEQMSLYKGSDPAAELQAELVTMIFHGKLGPSVRIDSQNKTVVKLQRSYGNTSKKSHGGNKTDDGKQIVDEAILGVAEQVQSEVGLAYTRAAERLIRTASLRATRMDDIPKKEGKERDSSAIEKFLRLAGGGH